MGLDFLGFGDYFVLCIGVFIAPILAIAWFLKTKSHPLSQTPDKR
jgi:hypothetical protein